ncbi:MAG TPA: cytochrome P460 family protein [Steroidobacteraceae bacterium]
MISTTGCRLKYGLALIGLTICSFCYTADSKEAAPEPAHNSIAAPVFGIAIPPRYREWQMISVAHEEGSLNDIRAILGNDVALKAYRQGLLPFPEGSVIVRLAYSYVPSEENNKVFGRAQSFVAGPPTDWYLQVMVKDSKKYASTHGWGYAQFDKDGKPADAAKHNTCAPCHEPASVRDFVFTRYAP